MVLGLICPVNTKRPSTQTTSIKERAIHQPYQQTGSAQEEQPHPKMD